VVLERAVVAADLEPATRGTPTAAHLDTSTRGGAVAGRDEDLGARAPVVVGRPLGVVAEHL
jgi:hypothetical protein